MPYANRAGGALLILDGEHGRHAADQSQAGEGEQARGETSGVLFEPRENVGANAAGDVAEPVDHANAARSHSRGQVFRAQREKWSLNGISADNSQR